MTTKMQLADDLVQRYYLALSKDPSRSAELFQENSLLSWLAPGQGGSQRGPTTTKATGQEKICEQIMASLAQLGSNSCQVERLSITYQDARKGAVVAHASGDLVTPGRMAQAFSQTFFLETIAPVNGDGHSHQRLYIYHSVLRYEGPMVQKRPPIGPPAGSRQEAHHTLVPAQLAPQMGFGWSPSMIAGGLPTGQGYQLPASVSGMMPGAAQSLVAMTPAPLVAPSSTNHHLPPAVDVSPQEDEEGDGEGMEEEDEEAYDEHAEQEDAEACGPSQSHGVSNEYNGTADDELTAKYLDELEPKSWAHRLQETPRHPEGAAAKANSFGGPPAQRRAAGSQPQGGVSGPPGPSHSAPLAQPKGAGKSAGGGSSSSSSTRPANAPGGNFNSTAASAQVPVPPNAFGWLWVSRLPSEPPAKDDEVFESFNAALRKVGAPGEAVEIDRKDPNQEWCSIQMSSPEAAEQILNLSRERQVLLRGRYLKAEHHRGGGVGGGPRRAVGRGQTTTGRGGGRIGNFGGGGMSGVGPGAGGYREDDRRRRGGKGGSGGGFAAAEGGQDR